MNRHHPTQFTLAGLMALMLLVSVVMAGAHHLGAVPFATFIDVIPYCLFAMASMVFLDCLRSGVLRWVLVISGTALLAIVVHHATHRAKVWSGVVTNEDWALIPTLSNPVRFVAFLVFGVSLLLTAFRIRRELTS